MKLGNKIKFRVFIKPQLYDKLRIKQEHKFKLLTKKTNNYE